ncbi:caspase-2-like [Rhipicephalus microplus]|uniref:caspase-2-like n=1 Tax=Rhipicephalus microplus TaxID=6941 RepID=UPI003F6AF1B6
MSSKTERIKAMKKTLQKAAKLRKHKVADCLVIVLMSHGGQDIIYGVDLETVRLEDEVFSLFDNESCPALQGKPKLFFVQACRESALDRIFSAGMATPVLSSLLTVDCLLVKRQIADDIMTMPGAPMPSLMREERRATWSDIYIAYATTPGSLAFYIEGVGSWFLLSMYNVFCKHAGTLELDMLMKLVCKDVMARTAPDGSKQTPSKEIYGWKKKLYFNPGFTVRASESSILCCVKQCLCTPFKTCQGRDNEPADNERC